MFNIFIADMFHFISDIDKASYADDNTPYVYGENLNNILRTLESSTNILLNWFDDNSMKSNTEKCHLLFKSDNPVSINLGDSQISNSKMQKLLGVNIDVDLTFESHVKELCKKASQKLSTISRISSYMTLPQRKLIVNAFFKSQFNYCPLIWMNHSRSLNNKINRLHERRLRIIYNDNISSFKELLEEDAAVTIHQRNIQVFVTELFKIKNNLSPPLMREIFPSRNISNKLRSDTYFMGRNVKTINNGTESLTYLAPKIWNILPTEIKEAKSLEIFKEKVKKWVPHSCPCRLCKTYIQNISFIDIRSS